MIGGLLAKQMVRRGFAALNLCDVDGVMALFADDAVLEFPGTSALAGRYEGAEAIRHFLVERCARVERLHYTLTHVAVTETLTLGTSNTVLVEWVLVETMPDGRGAPRQRGQLPAPAQRQGRPGPRVPRRAGRARAGVGPREAVA
jgi:ketosteroid isomerase-like protein